MEKLLSYAMNKKTTLGLVWIILCVFFIFMKGVSPGWQEERSDFSNYYYSAILWLEGKPISNFYNNEWFEKEAIAAGVKEGAKFSPFPPSTTFLYLPLTVFKPLKAKKVWLVCNILLLGVLIFQMKSISSLSYLEIGITLSLFTIPIASNIRLGQSYLLFSVLIFGFFKATKNNKNSLGGAILGIAAAIKYFPFVYLFYGNKKSIKSLIIGCLTTILIVSLLPIFTEGIDLYMVFLHELWNHSNGNLSGQGQFSYTFQSIDVLLANLFIYDEQLNPTVLLNLPVLKGIFKLVFMVAISLITFNVVKGQKKPTNLTKGFCIIACMLLIPASASYHLLLLIPAIYLIISFLGDKVKTKKEDVIVGFLVFVSCNLLPHHIPHFPWNETINTVLHFPRLLGLIVLFIYLIRLQKRYLQVNE